MVNSMALSLNKTFGAATCVRIALKEPMTASP